MKRYKIIENDIEYDIEENLHGSRYWYLNNVYHREVGPAWEIEGGGTRWYFYGKVHRSNGPAWTNQAGEKIWFWHGRRIDCQTQEEFERALRMKAFW